MVGAKAEISHLFSFPFNKKEGTYLIALYLSIKLLYLVNVIAQFFILIAFMATKLQCVWIWVYEHNDKGWGYDREPRVSKSHTLWLSNSTTPERTTMDCRLTLPINFFNEKIFIFYGFGFSSSPVWVVSVLQSGYIWSPSNEILIVLWENIWK